MKERCQITKINIGNDNELLYPEITRDAGAGEMKEQVVRKGRRIVYKKLQKRNSKTVMMDPRLGY
jgi:hypothetical protein